MHPFWNQSSNTLQTPEPAQKQTNRYNHTMSGKHALRIDETDSCASDYPPKRYRPSKERDEQEEMVQWVGVEGNGIGNRTSLRNNRRAGGEESKREEKEEQPEEDDTMDEAFNEDSDDDDEGDLEVAAMSKSGENDKLSVAEIIKKVQDIPAEEKDETKVKTSMLWKVSKAAYHLNFHFCTGCKDRINKLRENEVIKEFGGTCTFKIPFCDNCVRLNMVINEASTLMRDLKGENFFRNGQTMRLSKLLPKPTTTLSLNLCKDCNKAMFDNKKRFLYGGGKKKGSPRTLWLELSMCRKCMGHNSVETACCQKFNTLST